jgi:hypothetical protein
MNRGFLLVLLLACISTCIGTVIPRGFPTEGYTRRPGEEKVKQQLIQYWSQPDVLKQIPQPMKGKIKEYIKAYKSSEDTSSSSKKHHPCEIL